MREKPLLMTVSSISRKGIPTSTATMSIRGFITLLTSFSVNEAMPFSMFFSSKGVDDSVAMLTAVERSSMEMSAFFRSKCLSINEVELTSSLLRGLNSTMSTCRVRAMKRAKRTGFLAARIFGMISPMSRTNEVTTTSSMMKAAAGWLAMSNISLTM